MAYLVKLQMRLTNETSCRRFALPLTLTRTKMNTPWIWYLEANVKSNSIWIHKFARASEGQAMFHVLNQEDISPERKISLVLLHHNYIGL